MNIMKARFICSVEQCGQLPSEEGDEFCIMGRSNVGKSSFINHVFNDRKLARVSRRPGKTTLANFYRTCEGTVWVDLPGYGFAFAPKGEKIRWSRLVEEYCEKRGSLKGCIWLLDIRHAGLSIDEQAHRWLIARRMPLFTILTKCDKISKHDLRGRSGIFMETFGLTEEPLLYSITWSACREEFWRRFSDWRKAVSSSCNRHSRSCFKITNAANREGYG